MAQHDYVIANGSGAVFRADINSALAAIASTNKGPTAPSTPTAGMIWIDDNTPSASVWTVCVYDGAAWIRMGVIDTTADVFAVVPEAWTDLASAGTTDLGATNAANLRITGTTTITAFGTAPSGTRRQLRFAGALTLTHNGTSLILPGGANITTTAGDTAVAVSLGSGNWVVVNYEGATQAAERARINAPPLPTNAAGVGNMGPLNASAQTITIGAGGTWAVMIIGFSAGGTVANAALGGVVAGGTTIDMGSPVTIIRGFAWRIT